MQIRTSTSTDWFRTPLVGTSWSAVLAVVAGVAWFVGSGPAITEAIASPQIQVRRAGVGAIRLGGGGFGMPMESSGIDEEASEIEGGGVVKTDPDLESIMKKAERYREDGNFRVAAQLWQAVLERSGDSLFSSDGQLYYSMVQKVEDVIAELPPEGLAMYRINADAKAKELIAKAADPNDIQTLSEIVRQYFLSSEGDDAAFRLGCIYLDQYDFVGARRLFEKVANRYPDSSIPDAELHSRIALCETFLGNLKSAKTAVDLALSADSGNRQVELVADTIKDVESGKVIGGSMGISLDSERDWRMPLAGAGRNGIGRSVPDAMMEQDLVAIWQYAFDPKDRFVRSADTVGQVWVGDDASNQKKIDAAKTGREKTTLKKWQEKNWRPAGHLLIQGDNVFFKSGADLVAWSRNKVMESATAQVKMEKDPSDSPDDEAVDSASLVDQSIAWRSVQRNIFLVDDATLTGQSIFTNYSNNGRMNRADPETPVPFLAGDVQLFGDRIHSQMSIHNGMLLNIEGEAFDERYNKSIRQVTPAWNQPYRRTRDSQLAAYEADSGVLKWRLPRQSKRADKGQFEEGDEPDWLDTGGFMAAPIGYGNLVIAPINKGGAIWVYGFDLEDQGKTVWKSYLCDEPEAGADAWSAIQLSLDGSDLFVSCGLGVIFVLDPSTGTIRLAKRYARIGVLDPFYRQSNWSTKRALFDGWSSDTVIPYKRQAICFCSDTQVIEAIDRNSGATLWRSDIKPIEYKVDYLLGVKDGVLYAAGKETIIAYDLEGTGRMIWGADPIFEDKVSFGRGWLTDKGIYMPVQDKIFLFSLDGKLLKKVHVDLGGSPVGNLYSDGERFWVHNGSRLFVLGAKSE